MSPNCYALSTDVSPQMLPLFLHPLSHTTVSTSFFADTVPAIDLLAEETHSTAGAKAIPTYKCNSADLDLSRAVKTSTPQVQQ